VFRYSAQYSGGMPNREDGIQVLRRAAEALDEIATAPGALRLVDLGARLGLAKSTARRLLVGLVEVGYAAVDDGGRIVLGDRLLGLGTADASHLAAQFRPALEAIAAVTGETVDLSVLRGNQMWFIDQIESAHRLRAVSAVGVRFPVRSTANGKAALAALDDAELARIIPPGDPLHGEINEIRSSGIAFDHDEHTPGISAAGVAGRVAGGHIVAISVPAPTGRFTENQTAIEAALRAHAFREIVS